ncbi:hypothetical protein [Klebsiella pneumoniae]|uniref:hypothetical protein n=1 Tax=Klebsiella pneumoniae TaxID=573 RepID=UPI0013EF3EB3|nr:hypothetical protein [Klebsiella pneumoniae]HCM5241666.1 hypothetical protein [Klebsiella variicola subsp. variicola]
MSKLKLLKVTVRQSGNPVYFGRTRVARNAQKEVSLTCGRSLPTGCIDTKQRYLKLTAF